MKKLTLTLIMLFYYFIGNAQTTVLIVTNFSPFDIQLQLGGIFSPNDPSSLTNSQMITIPAGSIVAPVQYTFSTLETTTPAGLTSQFTHWTYSTIDPSTSSMIHTNYTKSVAQTLFSSVIWDHVKFDAMTAGTNNVLGSGGVGLLPNYHYPSDYPSPDGITPGSPMTSGTLVAGINNIGTFGTFVQFMGSL